MVEGLGNCGSGYSGCNCCCWCFGHRMTSPGLVDENSPQIVYTVRCFGGDGFDETHIFSTMEKALAFAKADDRAHVISDYAVDCPERMDLKKSRTN